jgi:ribosomal protein S18 acetylase RimI-like enzyme
MKSGSIYREFEARDGRKVILRSAKWEDLDDMVDLINGLVEEEAMISMSAAVTRSQEVDWLAGVMIKQERDEVAMVVAEAEGHMIGNCLVRPMSGRSRHVGVIGIIIRSGYRDCGIGAELMLEAEAQSRRLGLEILKLDVYGINSKAIHLYEKLGYSKMGILPEGAIMSQGPVDVIHMYKKIKC